MGFESFKKKYPEILIILAALFWSFNGVLIKGCSWNSLSFSIFRGVCTFIGFTLIAIKRKTKIKLTPLKLILALCVFLQFLLYNAAMKFTTAGNTSALQNSSPIYIMIMSALILKKKPTKLEIITCALLIGGIVISIIGSTESPSELAPIGDMLALLSGVFYAGVFFFSSLTGTSSAEALVIGNFPYVLMLPIFFSDPIIQQSTATDYILPLISAVFSGFLAWYFILAGIEYTSALKTNFLTMIEPVLSPVWAFLIVGETMPKTSIIGVIIVLATLIVYNYLSNKEEKKNGETCEKEGS